MTCDHHRAEAPLWVSLAIVAVATVVSAFRIADEWPALGPTDEVRMPVVYDFSCSRARLRGDTCFVRYEVTR